MADLLRDTALVISLLAALVFFLLGRETQSPAFAVSEPELIAESYGSDGGLKVLWDDKEVENAVSMRIVIWNEGTRFIRASDFSETDPIRIVPSQNVDILSVETGARSREGLNFEKRIEKYGNDRETVVLRLVGDEALEASDGAIFRILYAGSEDCSWLVRGRVLGVPEGFQSKGEMKRTLDWWIPLFLVLPTVVLNQLGKAIVERIRDQVNGLYPRLLACIPPTMAVIGFTIGVWWVRYWWMPAWLYW